jgi:hypothetical protein
VVVVCRGHLTTAKVLRLCHAPTDAGAGNSRSVFCVFINVREVNSAASTLCGCHQQPTVFLVPQQSVSAAPT